jgi:hypothetical protein
MNALDERLCEPPELWTDHDNPDPCLDAAYRSGMMPPDERATSDEGDGWDAITVLRVRGRRLAKLIGHDGDIVGYDAAKHFDLTEIPVDGLYHLEEDLQRLIRQPDRCIVRGQIANLGRTTGVRRLLHPDGPDPASLVEVPRRWLPLDIDGLARPAVIAAADLIACAGTAIAALPREFHGARCLVQATASHGFKPGLRLRLWYWLDRPVSTAELKRWLPAEVVDHAVFSAAQIIYTAAPVFDGASDPLPVRLVQYMSGDPVVQVPLPEKLQAHPRPIPAKPQILVEGLSPLGKAILDRAESAILGAEMGAQETTLVRRSFAVGCAVADGKLPEALARNVLLHVARRLPQLDPTPWVAREVDDKVLRSFSAGMGATHG